MRSRILVPLLLVLSSCGSPPKPPSVNDSHKRPANTETAVRLQACEGDLQNTRLAARESERAATVAKGTAIQLASQQQALTARALRAGDRENVVYSILFAFGKSDVDLTPAQAAALSEAARTAVLIFLRGRTDGAFESAAESRIARERSEAVRAYLIKVGIDPIRIRTTWQPVGDIAAANTSEAGRRLNRRVEVELYRVAPRLAALGPLSEP